MFVRWFYYDLVFFSFFFSILFCFFCSLVDNLFSFWVFLELCGMSIVPCFFYTSGSGVYGFYSSLLTYVIMSGLSSVFFVSGLLFVSLYYFIFIGFVIKFGLFPFSLWVYRVFSESNWIFIFFLSVILKFPVLFFCFMFQDVILHIVYVDCSLTILMCALFLWLFSQNWEYIWCHISLSSVSTLIVACFCSDIFLCFCVYFYYLIWATFCIMYLFYLSDVFSFNYKFWLFCFLFLITPLSFPLFYKLLVTISIFCSCFYLLFVWCFYSFSEQFFLYKLAGDYFYSGVFNSWC